MNPHDPSMKESADQVLKEDLKLFGPPGDLTPVQNTLKSRHHRQNAPCVPPQVTLAGPELRPFASQKGASDLN